MEIVLCVMLAIILVCNGVLLFFIIRKKQSNQTDLLFAKIESNNLELKSFTETSHQVLKASTETTAQNNLNFFSQLMQTLKNDGEVVAKKTEQLAKDVNNSLSSLTKEVLDSIIKMQFSNEQKLGEMRAMVDEKLSASIEKKFNESFNLISNRLESVSKGLGEMQNLASNVGDLKKALTNVKTRGSLGEIQLGSLLEQLLSPNQFERNVQVKNHSAERVDYVVFLPTSQNENTMLPIDCKFPIEAYGRLVSAFDSGAENSVIEARKELMTQIKKEAKSIAAKYVNPPKTMDYAIMFLPTEGLFSEVMRDQAMFEMLFQEHKVLICGPTTMAAILSSFQLGIKAFNVEKRSNDVLQLFMAFKKDFAMFAKNLDNSQKKIDAASKELEQASKRTSMISKKLSKVSAIDELQTEQPAISFEETDQNED